MNTASQLTDVPAGNVPEYTDFKRHIWKHGSEAVKPPPWVYSVVIQDAMEYDACADALGCAVTLLGGSRFRVRDDIEDNYVVHEVFFADIEALHAFMQCVAIASRVDVRMRHLGDFIMYTLGYRWV